MTVAELTRALKLTETAVRRHLQTLIKQGYVTHSLLQGGAGRPAKLYSLTDKVATDYFPTGYEELAARVLDTLHDTGGHQLVLEYLFSSNRMLANKLSAEINSTDLKERVLGLVEFFKTNGYMTNYKELQNGDFFLYNQNCAIYNLANQYRQLCLVELRLIELVTGAKVTRKQYILKGQPVCGYRISHRSL